MGAATMSSITFPDVYSVHTVAERRLVYVLVTFVATMLLFVSVLFRKYLAS